MNPGRALSVFLILLCGLLIVSCATAPTPEDPEATAESEAGSQSTAAAGSTETDESGRIATTLQEYLDVAYDKLDTGLVSEGILNFVSVLSELSKLKSPAGDLADFGSTAEEELTKIGSGLSLEASVEWLDANNNQTAASTLDVGTPQAMGPSVTLTYSYGNTKALVSGAPVHFRFVKGSGILVSPVSTNEYGQANTVVTRVDSVNQENIVRASLTYRVKGYSYEFSEATRDFAFVPPVNKASLLVLERGPEGASDDPIILDPVFNVMKTVNFDYAPYNGLLLGDDYLKVFGGDNDSIVSMGLEEGVSYLVMVLSDNYYVKQVELDGKKYNIFKSKTNVTTRIIRVADGAIIYSASVQDVDGQANTEQKASIDGYRKAADAMAAKLTEEIGVINDLLVGGE